MLGAGLAFWVVPAQAQVTADMYFPTGTYGYDQDLGVTVLTRARPEYEQTGVQLGGFTIRPELDQSIFDNTNVNGLPGNNTGSWGSETAGSVFAASNWSRNNLEANLSFDHDSFFTLPNDNYTNWNAGLSGGYTIAGGTLQASYAHTTYNELGTEIGFARSEAPAENTTDTGEVSYDFNLGRITITPSVDYSAYRYGNIVVDGLNTSQTYLNHNDFDAGIVTRYALTGGTGLLLVTRGGTSEYISQIAGQPSNDSVSGSMLVGLDYQSENVWRYSLLVGFETRSFAASQYGTYTVPIVSGQVIWTPKPVLTVTGSATRTIEDADTTGNDGYILNEAKIVADYELLRNILLEGRANVEYLSYLQGGTQASESVGGGVTWLLSRRVQLSVNDDFTNQNAPSGMTFPILNEPSGAYTQNIFMLTLHLAL